MAFVLDASIAIAWFVGKQATPYTNRLRLRAKREPLHVPALWRLEVVNERPMRETLSLARRYALSSYDVMYLALAGDLRLRLACKDGPLRAALSAAGVKLA